MSKAKATTEEEPEVEEPEEEAAGEGEVPAEVVPTAFDPEAEQPEAPEQKNYATLEEAMAGQNEAALEAAGVEADTAPESEFEPADKA